MRGKSVRLFKQLLSGLVTASFMLAAIIPSGIVIADDIELPDADGYKETRTNDWTDGDDSNDSFTDEGNATGYKSSITNTIDTVSYTHLTLPTN